MKLFIFFLILLGGVFARKGFGPGEQEWGYSEVRPGAQMFWWLYYTTHEGNPTDKPLVIWLQGGPGISSTGYGNFMELGPLDSELKSRNYTWVKNCNVMFVDNPVETGFSYVEDFNLLATTNKQIAMDLVEMIKDFYKKFPKFQSTPLYVLSESHGGKMAAEFALELDLAIKRGEVKGNFKGVGLGGAWISPIDFVMTWAPYLLQFGLVDQRGYQEIMTYANATQKAINEGQWLNATYLWGYAVHSIVYVAHGVDFFNVLSKVRRFENRDNLVLPESKSRDDLDNIMNVQVREALGDIPEYVHWTEYDGFVFDSLTEDFMKPVTNIVEQLLNSTDIKVTVYSGQLDLFVDTPGTVKWVENLNWKFKKEWIETDRIPLVSNGYIEGFVKKFGNFGMYWVNRAGHMMSSDNPAGMDAILKELTNNYLG